MIPEPELNSKPNANSKRELKLHQSQINTGEAYDFRAWLLEFKLKPKQASNSNLKPSCKPKLNQNVKPNAKPKLNYSYKAKERVDL